MFGLLHKLEQKIAPFFNGLPKLSSSTNDALVTVWPFLALIGGLLQLFAAWEIFKWARQTNQIVNFAENVYRDYGVDLNVSRWSIWLVVAVAILVFDAIILLLAYPKLQKRQKSGWDLLLLSAILSVIYGIISLFMDYRGGVISLFWNFAVAFLVFYLLFNVRAKYAVKPKNRK